MAQAKKQQEEQPDAEKAAREAVRETDAPEESESFSVERLIKDAARLVGHDPHVVAGALAGVNRKNLTVEEAKAAADKWLESPAKED